MKPFHIASLLTILMIGLTERAHARDIFSTALRDSTLRLDYTLGRTATSDGNLKGIVLLNEMAMLPRWAGRRHSLDFHPLKGDGRVTMTDAATGDTLYVNTFSTLFHEWAADAPADATPPAFEHTVLIPMPRHKAKVTLTLNDKYQRLLGEMTHEVDPDDILIRPKGMNDSDYRVRTLHEGAWPNPIDVVVLAEGYREEEMELFFADAASAVKEILRYEPFNDMQERFRITAVATPSADSGVSIPKNGDWRHTAFGSHFSTFGADRYLTSPRVHAMHDAAAGVPYEHIIILANSDEYGGGGIYNSYTLMSAHTDRFLPALVHEFGHSFGGLADEYFYDTPGICTYPLDVEPWEQNVTTLTDFASKWEDMVESGEAGLYEGGAYMTEGVWRGVDECRMRNNTTPDFCAVCRRALRQLIDFYTLQRTNPLPSEL